jgi:hypothetical protein
MGPQNADGPFKPYQPYKLTQNKTDLNHHTFSKEWLIVSVKIPHHTNLFSKSQSVVGY